MTNRFLLLASLAVGALSILPMLTGCGHEHPKGPAVAITGEAKLLPNGVANGRAANLHAGANEAFWLWHDTNGGEWHIRSTTAAQHHRFQGRVKPVQGAVFSEVKPSRVDYADKVRLDPGGLISFDFETQGGDDGFDWKVTGHACVEVHVEVDGENHPHRILLGANQVDPGTSHFIVCP